MNRPPLGTSLVVGALVIGSLALGAASGPPAAPRPAEVEVVGATAVCPDLRQDPPRVVTRVSVGAAPLPVGRTGAPGTVEVVPVRGGASRPVGVRSPGQVAVGLGRSQGPSGLVVTATGELAAGLEVEQVTRGTSGESRGLAGLRCDAPRREAWFVGGATTVGDTARLVLVNVDDTPSTVDVSVFSGSGPVDNRAGQGITVQPHARTVIKLEELAPDRSLLAVHVVSRRGRVAAGLRHSKVDGRLALGSDWVPRAAPPAGTVVVPGLPQGTGRRLLMVSNPGLDDTVVAVRVTTADGQYVPTSLDEVAVPAGTTVGVRLDAITRLSALTATVTSDGPPVVAGAFVQERQEGAAAPELAYTGGTLPLSGPALLTDLVIDRPTESTLILSAPDAEATVVVTPIQVLGTAGTLPGPKTVTVPAGRTATLRLSTFFPPGTRTRLAVEVSTTSGSGPVYASRYLRERTSSGPLITLLDLQGPAQRVPRPAVDRDPRVAS